MLADGEAIGLEPPELIDQIIGALFALVVLSPAWLIFVFAAYAIGRKRFTLRYFLVFVTVEAVALWLAGLVYSMP